MIRLHALPQSPHQQLGVSFQMSEDGVTPGVLVGEPTELMARSYIIAVELDVYRWSWSYRQRNHSGQVYLKQHRELVKRWIFAWRIRGKIINQFISRKEAQSLN